MAQSQETTPRYGQLEHACAYAQDVHAVCIQLYVTLFVCLIEGMKLSPPLCEKILARTLHST